MMLSDFLKYIEVERRYSFHTISSYKGDLEAFFSFHGNIAIQKIERAHVRAWVIHLSDQGLEPRSINRKLSAIKSFFKFQMFKNQMESNPAAGVVSPKVKKRLPVFVPEKDLDKLVTNLEDLDLDIRGRCILELFYQTGIRLSELINIKRRDLQNGEIKVLGKRSKERIIPISNSLSELLQEWQEYAKENLPYLKSDFLFVTDKGDCLYPNFVYRLVKESLGKISTLEKRSPHILRHSFATHMLNNGAEIESVKELLGHSSLAATQVYTHNSISKLKKAYQNSHPRGN